MRKKNEKGTLPRKNPMSQAEFLEYLREILSYAAKPNEKVEVEMFERNYGTFPTRIMDPKTFKAYLQKMNKFTIRFSVLIGKPRKQK